VLLERVLAGDGTLHRRTVLSGTELQSSEIVTKRPASIGEEPAAMLPTEPPERHAPLPGSGLYATER
jgi:hypothetical protein